MSKAPTITERQELATIEARLTEMLDIEKAPRKDVSKAYNTFKTAAIRPSGNGFTGAPIIAPGGLNRQKGEIPLNNLEDMLSGFAYDACYNHSA